LARGRVLCIGDRPAHDIAGARGMGLASCLVETGVGAPAHQAGPPADLVMRAFAP
jgi:ribonucleotide monophosphatase NagD (HAD superfamily)